MKWLSSGQHLALVLFLAMTFVGQRRVAAWPVVGLGPPTPAAEAAAAGEPLPASESFGSGGGTTPASGTSVPVCPPCPCAPASAAVTPGGYSYPPPPYSYGAYPPPYGAYPPPPSPPGWPPYGRPAPPPRGQYEHEGFYLRTFLGASSSTFTSRNGVDRTKITGGGGAFGLAMGGHVGGGFILYGELDVAGPASPVTVEGSTAFDISEMDLVGVGVGGAYYFMPFNVYLSATALLAGLSVTTANKTSHDSGNGGGVSVMIGKEWWVSPEWGLGVAGQSMLATMTGGDLGPARWNAVTWALALSATYN